MYLSNLATREKCEKNWAMKDDKGEEEQRIWKRIRKGEQGQARLIN